MRSFEIINNISDIESDSKWIPAAKFNSRDRIVNSQGQRVHADYQGYKYRIIEKKEHLISSCERFRKGFLGALAVICSLCLVFLFKKSSEWVNNQFKSKESMHYGIWIPPSAPVENPKPPEKIRCIDDTVFRVDQGKLVYFQPKILLGLPEDLELNFALIKTEGNEKFVAVRDPLFGCRCTIYEGTPLEALLKIAQNSSVPFLHHKNRHYGSPIGYILNHPLNLSFTEKDFFEFILKNDENGTPRICTLNFASTLEVLNIIKEKSIPVKSYKALFDKWTNERKEEITQLIIQLDPSVTDTEFYTQDDKLVYINPQLLFGGTLLSLRCELNFALIQTNGKQELVPVTIDPYARESTRSEIAPLEALLKLAQDNRHNNGFWSGRHYGSPIGHLLNHPANSIITEEEFFHFLLEKNEDDTPRIFTLNDRSLLEALNIIKDKKMPLNLHEKNGEEKTLFNLYAGQGNTKITSLLLEIDPSIILQTQGQGQNESVLIKAALRSSDEAQILLKAMQDSHIVLTFEEEWIRKALENDLEFTEEEFINLDQNLKVKIFYVANAFGHEELVQKLKICGMDADPLLDVGPSIFARNMDIITAKTVLGNFLQELRQTGQLLTHEEFSQLDAHNYIEKENSSDRIQGRNFLEKIIIENGLKHIKVPKKIVVINQDVENISFRIGRRLNLITNVDHVTLYAERIKPIQRKLSLEEALEWMIVLEKTGYGDIHGSNFFLTENDIYFIDTEFKDFAPYSPSFDVIESIANSLDDQDKEAFLTEYDNRQNNYVPYEETTIDNPYEILTKGYTRHEFTYPVSTLV